jgi:hypothetical protein
MLGELDLASMWLDTDKSSLKATWLFQVNTGGWLELECTRNDFYTQHELQQPKEWLVAGYQECVSILSASSPEICERPVNVGA